MYLTSAIFLETAVSGANSRRNFLPRRAGRECPCGSQILRFDTDRKGALEARLWVMESVYAVFARLRRRAVFAQAGS
jgi:hypothetical protein